MTKKMTRKEEKEALEAENKLLNEVNDKLATEILAEKKALEAVAALDTEVCESIDTETGEIIDNETQIDLPTGVASTYLTDMFVSSCMVDIKAYREGGKFRTKLLDMHADDELQIGSILGTVSSVERDTDKNDKAIIKMGGTFEIRRDDNSIVKGSQITLPVKAAGSIAGIVDNSPTGFEPAIFIEVFIKQYAQSPTGYTYIYKVQATAPEVSMFDDNPFLLTQPERKPERQLIAKVE